MPKLQDEVDPFLVPCANIIMTNLWGMESELQFSYVPQLVQTCDEGLGAWGMEVSLPDSRGLRAWGM